jgi:hypothetical protein
MLQQRHEMHTETSTVESMITDCFIVDIDKLKDRKPEHLTITQILKHCGFSVPNKDQIKQGKSFLEKKGFVLVKSSGIQGYWIEKRDNFETGTYATADYTPNQLPYVTDWDAEQAPRKPSQSNNQTFVVVNANNCVVKRCIDEQTAMAEAAAFTNTNGNGHCTVEITTKKYILNEQFRG